MTKYMIPTKEKVEQENRYKEMEIWKDIPGYENIYQCSSKGRVKSLDREIIHNNTFKRFYFGRVLKPGLGKDGYRLVVLCKNGKRSTNYIHQLVMKTFVGEPRGNEEVIHLEHVAINENNSLKNLRYASRSCNFAFKIDDGTATIGEKNPGAKLKEKDVCEIKSLLKSKRYNQIEISKIYKVDPSAISRISTGKTWGWLEF